MKPIFTDPAKALEGLTSDKMAVAVGGFVSVEFLRI